MLSITPPVDFYRDPALFERERETIFGKAWQFFGLQTDLVRPGDYLAETLAGYPIVVVLDDQGALRGYHNVCRHRAGPLVGDAKGRCDREFVCQFHDWRYGFDGRLREATDFGAADGFDPRSYGLFPVRVEAWRGFIFVNLDIDAAPLIEALRPLEERFAGRAHRSARLRHGHPVACNWKVYVENYLDGVHLADAQSSIATHSGAHRHDVEIVGDVALHAVEHHGNTAENLWAWIWPNLGVTIYRGVLQLEQMRPEGPDRTQIDHIFLHAPEDPGVDAAILNSERVTEDRAWICERVQRNLDAGIFQQGVLSPEHEGPVAWFQGRVARTLAKS